MRLAVLIIVGALCGGMTQAHEKHQQTADRWFLDTAVDRCSLIREFTAPYDLTLAVSNTPGVDYYTVSLRGREIAPRVDFRSTSVSLLFHEADKRIDTLAMPGFKSAERGVAIELLGLKTEVVEALGRASAFSVVDGAKTIGPFALPSASRAARSLQTCVDEQFKEWGADPTQFEPGGARPVPISEPEDWYPRDAKLHPSHHGAFTAPLIRLLIGLEGHVEECAQINRKDVKIESIVCKPLLAQRLYTPAHDPVGKPVKGVAALRFSYIKRRFFDYEPAKKMQKSTE